MKYEDRPSSADTDTMESGDWNEDGTFNNGTMNGNGTETALAGTYNKMMDDPKMVQKVVLTRNPIVPAGEIRFE